MNDQKRVITNRLLDNIGGQPKVMTYYDQANFSHIDLYIGKNRPEIGINSYGTIGLSDYSIGLAVPEQKDLRVEFLGVCDGHYSLFPNLLSTAAFRIINHGYCCTPGTVYPNIVAEYYPMFEMKHLMFTAPYFWENLQAVETNECVITWLLAVPISDSEFSYLHEHGSDALEDLFEQHEIDVFCLDRDTVV